MTFKFGDILENGWTGKDNPYSRCIFLRESSKSIHVMDFDGKSSEFYNDGKHRLVKVGSVIDEKEMKQFKDDAKLKKKKWMNN